MAGGHIRDTKSRLSREHPHPSGLRPAIFPLGGGRLAGGPVCRPYGMAWAARPGGRALRASWSTEDGRPHGAAPTAEIGPGALVRQAQAQKWNRTSPNFPPAQAPSGAGRNRAQALLILRAGNVLPTSRGNPRNGGPGVSGPMDRRSEAAPVLGRVPRRSFGFFPIAGKETRRPQAAKLLCKERNCSIIAPSSAPFGGTFSQGEGL